MLGNPEPYTKIAPTEGLYSRRLLATGWAKDGQIGYAKPAAAMPELVRWFSVNFGNKFRAICKWGKTTVINFQKYDCALEETILTTIKDCGSKTATLSPNNAKILNKYDISREDALEQVQTLFWFGNCVKSQDNSIGIVDDIDSP